MDQWDQSYIDEEEPGYIEFGKNKTGALHFSFIDAEIDYRFTKKAEGNMIEFSFMGNDECDEICGRGVATQHSNQLNGDLYIHCGEGSSLIAEPFM